MHTCNAPPRSISATRDNWSRHPFPSSPACTGSSVGSQHEWCTPKGSGAPKGRATLAKSLQLKQQIWVTTKDLLNHQDLGPPRIGHKTTKPTQKERTIELLLELLKQPYHTTNDRPTRLHRSGPLGPRTGCTGCNEPRWGPLSPVSAGRFRRSSRVEPCANGEAKAMVRRVVLGFEP